MRWKLLWKLMLLPMLSWHSWDVSPPLLSLSAEKPSLSMLSAERIWIPQYYLWSLSFDIGSSNEGMNTYNTSSLIFSLLRIITCVRAFQVCGKFIIGRSVKTNIYLYIALPVNILPQWYANQQLTPLFHFSNSALYISAVILSLAVWHSGRLRLEYQRFYRVK